MNNLAFAAELGLDLLKNERSSAGYTFSPTSDRWQLNKDTSISLDGLRQVSEATALGCRLALTRYAQEYSADHTANLRNEFMAFIRSTGTTAVTSAALINWRSNLGTVREWRLGVLKGYLLAWHAWGFPGVSDEVEDLLRGWRFGRNERGGPIAQGDPQKGPYSDVERSSILDWANQALSRCDIELDSYSYLMTLIMTARRPVQIAALRGIDLIVKSEVNDVPHHSIRFPRAKQPGRSFRGEFRSLSIVEELYLTLRSQHRASVRRVKDALDCDIPEDLIQQIPVFVNGVTLKEIRDTSTLRDCLMGDMPDRLHARTSWLWGLLVRCEKACTVKSERTGERIHLSANRFRYTRGTNLRREGFGAEVIAELLDHTDTQNVKVYTKNTVQEAEIINRTVGAKLAPFAQACMGTLVDSEREAVRGDDPRSRIPNHKHEAVGNCGNYSYCTSGFKACYTCHFFQPWVDGPHKEVLEELYEEKERTAEAGCAQEIVNANDRLILAVEHCVALCEEAKVGRRRDDQPLEESV